MAQVDNTATQSDTIAALKVHVMKMEKEMFEGPNYLNGSDLCMPLAATILHL